MKIERNFENWFKIFVHIVKIKAKEKNSSITKAKAHICNLSKTNYQIFPIQTCSLMGGYKNVKIKKNEYCRN